MKLWVPTRQPYIIASCLCYGIQCIYKLYKHIFLIVYLSEKCLMLKENKSERLQLSAQNGNIPFTLSVINM